MGRRYLPYGQNLLEPAGRSDMRLTIVAKKAFVCRKLDSSAELRLLATLPMRLMRKRWPHLLYLSLREGATSSLKTAWEKRSRPHLCDCNRHSGFCDPVHNREIRIYTVSSAILLAAEFLCPRVFVCALLAQGTGEPAFAQRASAWSRPLG